MNKHSYGPKNSSRDTGSAMKVLVDNICGDVPSSSVVKTPPSNAGDRGSIPGRGTKISYAMGQLSVRVATRKKPPHTAMKSPCAATKILSCQISKHIIKKKIKYNI